MPNSLTKKHGNLGRRKEDDPFFAIWRHYHDTKYDIILSDKQEERLKIYEFAWDCYNQGFSRGELAKYLVEHFKEPENGGLKFSVRTAFDYIRDSIDIFGEINPINLNRERMVMIEIGKTLMHRSIADNKHQAAASFYQSLVKLYQFDKEDNEMLALLKKIEPMKIVISNDPEALKREAEELVQDISHEDVAG